MPNATLHPAIVQVLSSIQQRSQKQRQAYLAVMRRDYEQGRNTTQLSCSNLAHGVATLKSNEKKRLITGGLNIGIVTAYNDMLSAHQPYEHYPHTIKRFFEPHQISVQVAGGVPAMCDGVTQGQLGMQMSLWSRDVIARATAVSLSHQLFDAAIMLGICDKIVPGLLIGALQFAHLPILFLPSGPMSSGLSNAKKSKIRQEYAEGNVSKPQLLAAEMQCYHSSGTCTFYGTANTNQVMLECMGLQLPGASFAQPHSEQRADFTTQVLSMLAQQLNQQQITPLFEILDERALVNAVVGVLATGGSTNHTIHLIAIAKACGIELTWQDFADLAQVVPLLARVYPNGQADVNDFHAAGGTVFCLQELLLAGLMFGDALTVTGQTLQTVVESASRTLTVIAPDTGVLRSAATPFLPHSGLQVVSGNLGQAIVKTSAVDQQYWSIRAPARVFLQQHELKNAFNAGELTDDFVAVVRGQGPVANGMPELHQLMPILASLQSQGIRVALVTDGRLSGASGKVLAAIHCVPEAQTGGPLALVKNGDLMCLDARAGILQCEVAETDWQTRIVSQQLAETSLLSCGRALFTVMREQCSDASLGATTF